ncbi:MAG TPA: hypothetical protein PK711_10185 [Bacteroidales bacterium]|nr:hypothetical protein [Bacteroidales bacterium]
MATELPRLPLPSISSTAGALLQLNAVYSANAFRQVGDTGLYCRSQQPHTVPLQDLQATIRQAMGNGECLHRTRAYQGQAAVQW